MMDLRLFSGTKLRTKLDTIPKLNEFGDNKIASTVIFWNCKKSEITDDFFHWVMDDIGELIKENEKNLFDSELKNIELIMSQQFFCEKLPEIEYFTHGDYFIGERNCRGGRNRPDAPRQILRSKIESVWHPKK